MIEHFRLSNWETDIPLMKNPSVIQDIHFNAARELLHLEILETDHRYFDKGTTEEICIKWVLYDI